LDDGEMPIDELIHSIENQITIPTNELLLENGKVVYKNNSAKPDYKQSQVGTPDYSDLLLNTFRLLKL
jgi:hypothetical protein